MRRRKAPFTGSTRKGFTLIELIFAMMIIAVVFTVVPKIIFASNKSLSLGLKEEAFFNAMSLTGQIVHLPWDENNAESDKILSTGTGRFDCDADGYRVGGFTGSRNCIDSTLAASAIATENEYNDIDDYHGYSTTTSVGGDNRFQLDVDVIYTGDNVEPASADTTVALSDAAEGTTTNIKHTLVTVTSLDARRSVCSSFFFHSANLGHTYINRRAW